MSVAQPHQGGGEAFPSRFLVDAPWFRAFVGRFVIGGWAYWATKTARVQYHPSTYLEDMAALEPAIYVCWHANLLATPHMVKTIRGKVNLTSPHPDGQMAKALSEAVGIISIPGSGTQSRPGAETGGVSGFRTLLRALRSGKSLFLTAEVPPEPGRNVAPGIVMLARISGRPIIPVAAASQKRWILEKVWDRMQVNLPHSRWAVVGAAPLWVDDRITDDDAAAQIKRDLDAAYARALELTPEK